VVSKKIISGLLSVIVIVLLFPGVVYADMGPKPSVNIDFVGIENQIYYITLLSEEQSTGPHYFSTKPIDENNYLVREHKEEGIDAWQAFRNYKDVDGFYFINYFQRCNEQNTFNWTYYPPSTFKVLIYFPKEDKFISTEISYKYAFDSYYKVSILDNKTTIVTEKKYDSSAEMTSLSVRILLTMAVEILVALFFGLKKRNILLFIIAINMVTQIALNILLNIINYKSGGYAFVFNYIWMELLVVLIEAFVYSLYFSKAKTDIPIKKWIAPVYSIVANSASFILGLVISFKLPGIF